MARKHAAHDRCRADPVLEASKAQPSQCRRRGENTTQLACGLGPADAKLLQVLADGVAEGGREI
eukprot:4194143-Prymnesium_polylepis.1